MKSKLTKIKPNQKNIYSVPQEPNDYVIISKMSLKEEEDNNHIYNVVYVRYFGKYINRNKKMFVIRYYICPNFNIDCIKEYRINSRSKKTFRFESEYIIDNLMQINYKVKPIIPDINVDYNKNLFCNKCKVTCYTNDTMMQHVQKCPTYIYTLFGDDVPKAIKSCTKSTQVTNNVTINTNVTINNTSYIGFRRSGDELLKLLTDQEKIKILRSMNKVTDLIDLQWSYPHLQNIRVRNKNLYASCDVYDPDKQEFRADITKECIRYLITDRLDDIDYLAINSNDNDIIERINRYDSNLRSNDKRMNSLMKKTVNQLYCLTKEKKNDTLL